MSEQRVVDDPSAGRFVVRVGDDVAGRMEYSREGETLVVVHTVVEPAFEGRGIGSALARGVLDEARRRGVGVVPVCPFLRSYLQRHPDDLDLVPADRRAELALTPGDPEPDTP